MKKLIMKISIFFLVIFILDTLLSTLLFKGLNEFTGFNLNAKNLFVGHSHTVCAIDSNLFEKNFDGKATKLALHGINISDRYAILKYYYNRTDLKPEIVIFDIDESILSTPTNSLNSHTRFYPFISDHDIERYIYENEENHDSIIARKYIKTLRYNNSWILIRSLKGICGLKDDKVSTNVINLTNYKNRESNKVEFDENSEKIFFEIINYLSKQNATVVLAYYPKLFFNINDELNYQKVLHRISKNIEKYKNVYLLDYNKDYKNSSNIFFDPTHVNRKGQELISLRMAKDLRELQQLIGKSTAVR